jgi:branched-chain amino acid transport system substrate-binding protein
MVIDKAHDGVETYLSAQSLNAALGRLGQIDSPRGAWQFTANRAPLQKWYLRQVRKDGMVLSNMLTAELTTLG